MLKFLRVVILENARATLEKHWRVKPRKIDVSLSEAAGRVLAEDVVSKIDVPPFDRAAFDGYAVRAADTFGAEEDSPIILKCVGKLQAGTWPRWRVRAGLCLEIATGAPIPPGADAIVMVEQTATRGKSVNVYRAIAPSENIAQRGSDVRRGDKIVRAGKVLRLTDIGVLSAAGVKRIKVYAKPRVAIISSGVELLKPGDRLKRGKIYDVNGPALCEAARACGADPVYLGIVPDEARAIKALVRKGLASFDVVLLSGSSSAGAGDIAPAVVNQMGKPGVLVHGLAMKPGKPTFVAVVGGKPVFGLPGYPVSALMVFDQLVAPYLRRLSGLPQAERARLRAKLAAKIFSARGRRELVPVKLVRRGREFYAEPLLKGSGAITSLSLADGYIDVPLEREIVRDGSIAEGILFGGGAVG